MSDFVERCRQEWRRLGVPDPLADEMAADLASDLSEAEAEGVSAEEYLGASAFDPGAFAASWAAERGIIPEPTAARDSRRRPIVLVTFTAVAAVALVLAALLLATGEPKVTLTTSGNGPSQLPHQVLRTSAAAPVEWMFLFLAVAALGFAAWLWSRRHRLAATLG